MATKKLVRTTTKRANKSGKTALIVAMAAIAGTSVSQMDEAARAAVSDMKADMGLDATVLAYTWDPFDGLLA